MGVDHELLLGAAGVAFTAGGAAWAGVKLSLNGMKMGVKRIEDKLDMLEDAVQDNRNDITGIRANCVFHDRRERERRERAE